MSFQKKEDQRKDSLFSKKVKTSKFAIIDDLIIDKLSNEEGQFH
ncbi:Hypothetical protein PMN2A_1933 [Prochlorococcus marinus str. NATL2A]|uniref:Uncharacterized protein n=1 Tax=Prochlorococcus marinus (strain NATL2A) TaxID=59920 RepID=A7MDD0_PROMT|nr:Hypothetical protein PMN2A_1933 [Prochlorococcus marinus str. NATL2A]